jgi:hypothetical protein
VYVLLAIPVEQASSSRKQTMILAYKKSNRLGNVSFFFSLAFYLSIDAVGLLAFLSIDAVDIDPNKLTTIIALAID